MSKQDEKLMETTDMKQEEKPYVHTPGTTHINAFIAAVEEAKQKVAVVSSDLATAEQALLNKKQESGMI